MATITSTATVNSRANITKRINKKQQQNNLLNNIISKTLEFYQSHIAMYQDLSGSIKKISTSLNDISDTIPLDAKHVSAILGILAKNDTQSIEYILHLFTFQTPIFI
jgi:ABC-type transporter Mla subunit MlaD